MVLVKAAKTERKNVPRSSGSMLIFIYHKISRLISHNYSFAKKNILCTNNFSNARGTRADSLAITSCAPSLETCLINTDYHIAGSSPALTTLLELILGKPKLSRSVMLVNRILKPLFSSYICFLKFKSQFH